MLTRNKKAIKKKKPLSSFNFNKHELEPMSNIFLKKFSIFLHSIKKIIPFSRNDQNYGVKN